VDTHGAFFGFWSAEGGKYALEEGGR
jgi:hypothetical protein